MTLSHGLLLAEAVNFAAADWLPFGRNAAACYRKHRRTPVFRSQDVIHTRSRPIASAPE